MTAQSDSKMSFAVLGPGGVGGLLGALLARHGNEVLCLSGEATAARLRESGLTVRSERFGTFGVPVRAATELGEPVDACLVTVKATNIDAAIERVPAAALGDALVVPFLNGIEHVARLRRGYPAEQVVPATIQVESSRTAPGEIEHSSPFASIALAAGANDRGRVERLAERLESAGLDVSLRDDETAMLWDKLSFLAPLALLTTHMNAPVGVVRTERRRDLLAVVHEVASVAGKQGAEIDEAGVLTRLDGVPDAMRSSMQRDAAAGRDIEIEAIGGAIVRAAERAGVAVPVTSRLVADLRSRYKGGVVR